jgi:quercetin dioxygenase-like cupin family protein
MEVKHYIKNIDFSEVHDLKDLVEYRQGQVVSRTLAQGRPLSLTLFAFDKGEEISTHSASGDAMVHVIDGSAEVTIGDKKFIVNTGEIIIMPANIPHGVRAVERFKMFLTVVFSLT